MDPRERLARIALARTPGIGPRLYARLLDRFGSGEAALAALPRLVDLGRLPQVRPVAIEAAARELERAEALGVRFVLQGGPGYPARLLHLDDPPPVIALAGDPRLLARRMVAVVGARNASAAGMALTREIARDLAAAGLCVVSGLARGIDAAAHEGALTVDGATLAVLACGLDVAYPPENARLQERIRRHGLLLSERPLGAVPKARHFPARNRLIAALAELVLVVEAAERSGSLVTARFAAELGREVAAVPGSPADARHRGTNRLLREGAHLVESAADVLALLGDRPAPPAPRRRRPPQPDLPLEPWEDAESSPPAEEPSPPARPAAGPAEGGDGSLAERLLALLGPDPVGFDELVRAAGAPADAVREALFELELTGAVRWHSGDRIARGAG